MAAHTNVSLVSNFNAIAAWKRARLLDKELAKLAEKIKPYVGEGLLTHQQACDAMIQDMYVSLQCPLKAGEDDALSLCLSHKYVSVNSSLLSSYSKEQALKEDGKDKDGKIPERPANWEHAHNNVMLVFRLYYKFDQLDPDFPDPKPAVPIVVPSEKPSKSEQVHFYNGGPAVASSAARSQALNFTSPKVPFDGAALAAPDPMSERARVLKEVSDSVFNAPTICIVDLLQYLVI